MLMSQNFAPLKAIVQLMRHAVIALADAPTIANADTATVVNAATDTIADARFPIQYESKTTTVMI
jgi:CTP:molybdopterin cytidylyltransferase MocA